MFNNILEMVKHARWTLDVKKPELLTGIGIIGFVATIGEAIRNTPYAMMDLEDADDEIYNSEDTPTKKDILVIKAKAVAPHYVSTFILGSASMVCFIGSLHESNRRIAASMAAYAIVNDEARYLREEVEELEDKLAEKELLRLEDRKSKKRKKNESPESEEQVDDDINEVIPQSEEVLMCDKMSKRYFYSSPLKIKEVESKLNRELLLDMFVPLNDFYYEIGLSSSTLGEYFGWQAGDEIDFTFSSSLTPDNKPVVNVDYDVVTHMSNRVNY